MKLVRSECPIHAAIDSRSKGGLATRRCCHLGDAYIHERRGAAEDVRHLWFLNRVSKRRDNLCPEPELVWVASAEEAAIVWAEMEARLRDNAPWGLPYSAGVCSQAPAS